jgi:hypothetical protein
MEPSAPASSVRVERWFALLCAFPALTVGCVYAEAILASFVLGHWPVPSQNDPKDLSTAPFHVASTVLVLLFQPAALFALAVAIRSWRVVRARSAYWLWLAVLVAGYAVVVLSARVDIGNIWYWWWD